MRTLIALVSIAAVTGLAACGSNSEPTTTSAAPLYPKRAKVVRDARQLCSLIDAKSVASEYGGDPSDLSSVAHAYAKASYQPAFQGAAEIGCLKSLQP